MRLLYARPLLLLSCVRSIVFVVFFFPMSNPKRFVLSQSELFVLLQDRRLPPRRPLLAHPQQADVLANCSTAESVRESTEFGQIRRWQPL